MPAQIGLVGDTAVLECDASLGTNISASRNLVFEWELLGGAMFPDKARFTQNMQTLILTNLTIEDNQRYLCIVRDPGSGDFFGLVYPLNVLGKHPALRTL